MRRPPSVAAAPRVKEAALLSEREADKKAELRAHARVALQARLDAATEQVKERRKIAEDMGRMRLQAEASLSVATPWDLKRGRVVDGEHEFDVLAPRAGRRLQLLLRKVAITHWANECKGFSKRGGSPSPGWRRMMGHSPFAAPAIRRAFPGSWRARGTKRSCSGPAMPWQSWPLSRAQRHGRRPVLRRGKPGWLLVVGPALHGQAGRPRWRETRPLQQLRVRKQASEVDRAVGECARVG